VFYVCEVCDQRDAREYLAAAIPDLRLQNAVREKRSNGN
jgi:hypothetical protein